MKKITKIDPWSFGRVAGVMYVIMGAIMGAVIAVIFVLGSLFSSQKNSNTEILLGLGIMVIIPVFYGFFGFIFGALFAWIYNLAGKWTGGIKVEIEEAEN